MRLAEAEIKKQFTASVSLLTAHDVGECLAA